MDFEKNIINKGEKSGEEGKKRGRPLGKIPKAGGKRLGGSPERVNTLTGIKMREERKQTRGGRGSRGRGGTRMRGGANTQVIHKPK